MNYDFLFFSVNKLQYYKVLKPTHKLITIEILRLSFLKHDSKFSFENGCSISNLNHVSDSIFNLNVNPTCKKIGIYIQLFYFILNVKVTIGGLIFAFFSAANHHWNK